MPHRRRTVWPKVGRRPTKPFYPSAGGTSIRSGNCPRSRCAAAIRRRRCCHRACFSNDNICWGEAGRHGDAGSELLPDCAAASHNLSPACSWPSPRLLYPSFPLVFMYLGSVHPFLPLFFPLTVLASAWLFSPTLHVNQAPREPPFPQQNERSNFGSRCRLPSRDSA